jgi:hypothetical protein
MHFFAATTPTAAEKLRQIPMEFWTKVGIGILVIIAAVILLRKIAKVNKVILGVGVFLVVSIIGFNWIYERNEPTWATPAVQWLAGFFPSKGKVEKKPQP